VLQSPATAGVAKSGIQHSGQITESSGEVEVQEARAASNIYGVRKHSAARTVDSRRRDRSSEAPAYSLHHAGIACSKSGVCENKTLLVSRMMERLKIQGYYCDDSTEGQACARRIARDDRDTLLHNLLQKFKESGRPGGAELSHSSPNDDVGVVVEAAAAGKGLSPTDGCGGHATAKEAERAFEREGRGANVELSRTGVLQREELLFPDKGLATATVVPDNAECRPLGLLGRVVMVGDAAECGRKPLEGAPPRRGKAGRNKISGGVFSARGQP